MYFQNREELIRILRLKPGGNKGWFIGKCPFCGKVDKFGIIFNSSYKGENLTNFNCFSGKCQRKGGIFTLLKHIDRLDLLNFQQNKDVNFRKFLKNNIIELEGEIIDFKVKEISSPIGFRRIYEDEYLEKKRNFDKEDFLKFEIGKTNIDLLLKNYLIFLIREGGSLVGWTARYPRSKKEIDLINKKREKKILRYINSLGAEFDKIIYGYDEIKKGITDTVILVEGIMDKRNVDKILELDKIDNLKCIVSFGTKISWIQMYKLLLKEVKNIILLYDSLAISSSKKVALELLEYFDVKIGKIDSPAQIDKDPGDLTKEELIEVLDSLISPLNYYTNFLQKKIL